jgi:hypothetical protein
MALDLRGASVGGFNNDIRYSPSKIKIHWPRKISATRNPASKP